MNLNRPPLEAACLAVLLGHKAPWRLCAFSPKGDRIVSGDAKGTLKVWDAGAGEELLTAGTAASEPQIRTCRFSPGGARIEAAFDNDAVQSWDASTGNQLSFFDPVRTDLTLLRLYPNGTRPGAATPDGLVRLCEIPSGGPIGVPGEPKQSALWVCSHE